MAASIRQLLESQRRVLLDISNRNRLVHLPKRSRTARVVIVHDELSSEIYRLLVEEKKSLTFLSVADSDQDAAELSEVELGSDEPYGLPQPDEDERDARGVATRHSDTKLQTRLTDEHLQKRLLSIHYEARTMLEEQGVNVLYLALGQLKYRDAESSAEDRFAPLLLLPVSLERRSAKDRFVLRWTEDDPSDNLSLAEKLKIEFGITLPDLQLDGEGGFTAYCSAVRNAIASKTHWEVLEDEMVLGLFSFAKLLMFRDLDPNNWPADQQIDAHRLIAGLMADGFAATEGLLADNEHVDRVIAASSAAHILDCDSSQAIAVEEVRRGRDLVIQGPPGTGKSQTIANVIAAAVAEGKRVLFVAEKMAALDVVQRRLKAIGLGSICLELHSNKANKKSVLSELQATLALGQPVERVQGVGAQLEEARDELNRHADAMNTPLGAAKATPFGILGSLSRLQARYFGLPRVYLPDALSWDEQAIAQRSALVRDVATRLDLIGSPDRHPWRGVYAPLTLRPDIDLLVASAAELQRTLDDVQAHAKRLCEHMGVEVPPNLDKLSSAVEMALRIGEAPRFDRDCIASGIWSAGLAQLEGLVQAGKRFRAVTKSRAAEVNEGAWNVDWATQRSLIAKHGSGWLRWLNGPYRAALAELKSYTRAQLVKGYSERIKLLDDLIAGKQARDLVAGAGSQGSEALGSVWRGLDTDWDLSESIVAWVRMQGETAVAQRTREIASALDEPTQLVPEAKSCRTAALKARTHVETVFSNLKLSMTEAFGTTTIGAISLSVLVDRVTSWQGAGEALLNWMRYRADLEDADALGIGSVLETALRGEISTSRLPALLEQSICSAQLSLATDTYPDLARFEGARHEQLVTKFRELDLQRIAHARHDLAVLHFRSMPRAGGLGEVGILRAEIAKSRNHKPIRRLLREAGSAIQAIKPVFMMSPLSVAQFLEPGRLTFDLLVIDEASQIQPVDALGAVARAKQAVVVGDEKQLPPTSFFARLMSDDEAEIAETSEPAEATAAAAKDLESILSLCLARGISDKMLRWHYRSQHESLIAVSNAEFYDGRLYIVPSPFHTVGELGLRFHWIENGRFDTGRTLRNVVEAAAVAKAVMQHARDHSAHTLGVGCMSVSQRDAILDEVERLRREQPECEAFFHQHPNEPFFVKNLENIQGDERDVIFISVGYGPSSSDGRVYQRFGPLNSDGGHRRLNVLISRARKRCEIFSSLKADDIRVDAQSKHGIVAFKNYLKYAQTGQLGVAVASDRPPGSPFETDVADELAARDWEVKCQIGVAGFFIDLAVVDRGQPGRYLLGIECDGATYHSGRSARDRDRLRQSILEGQGWQIHRIWSVDWFQNREREIQRLVEALEKAASILTEQGDGAQRVEPEPASNVVAHAAAIPRRLMPVFETPSDSVGSVPYVKASRAVPRGAIHELPTPKIAAVIRSIIDVESPIHEQEIVTRVRELWGLGRAGNRIQDAVKEALRSVLRQSGIECDRDCYAVSGQQVLIRNRSTADSTTLRRPEFLPVQELREAVCAIVRHGHGLAYPSIALEVSRLLGFSATSAQLRQLIENEIDWLCLEGTLAKTSDGIVRMPDPSAA